MDDNSKIIEFLKLMDKFKFVQREIYLSDSKTKENDAEHSWHLAMFLMLFEKNLPKDLDKLKMLKMALIHDLPEIYAGDVFTFDKKERVDKQKRELDAAKKLFKKLPEYLEKEFMEIFLEFEEQKTKEAKIVKSFDKIQPLLQNLLSNSKGLKENNVSIKQVDEHKRELMVHDDFVYEIYTKLFDELKKNSDL